MNASETNLRLSAIASALAPGKRVALTSVPEGFDAIVLADLARRLVAARPGASATLVFVARDGQRLAAMEQGLGFVALEFELLSIPAWDCLPFDRVSPSAAVVSQRMTALARLARTRTDRTPRIVLTSVNAILQRVAARETMARETFSAAPGNSLDTSEIVRWLETNGFLRATTVREAGEFAVRGGILDLYPAGAGQPLRLDFFGDTLESIRSFDAETQRTTGTLRALDLVPMSEVVLSDEAMRRFRQAYIAEFSTAARSDPLYEAVSEGRRHNGMEHWLPLFRENLTTLADFLGDAPLALDSLVEEAVTERLDQIADYRGARQAALASATSTAAGGGPYRPLAADALYLSQAEWAELCGKAATLSLTPFAVAAAGADATFDMGGKPGRSFAPERADENRNVFDAAVAHLREVEASGRRVVVAGWSEGSRDRLAAVLADHGLKATVPVRSLAAALATRPNETPLAVWGLESGFETGSLAVVAEQDVLGDRLIRQGRRRKRAQDHITNLSVLAAGDLVVHVDHGIGRYVGLQSIEVQGAPHDCLELHYAGGDRLFLPVENIELLTRYGSEENETALDKLGGVAWQARKARLKQRIREMAGQLMAVAAARALREAPRLVPPEGLFDEFRARFPYEETDDQQTAIDAVLDDLAKGRPMDRLVCGDVGFGKTEVALRAAFTVAAQGRQVAVVVPTTLLSRQHHATFHERFKGFALTIAQASRFVPAAELKKVKESLADGRVDIVIGTHALLGKAIRFKDLGLVVVDEEQHFGVAHKERLKELRAEVHVLTLSATPIPRTLQLAMTGVRDLSIIATPPIDRLAVRTSVGPFDPLIVRETLLRERYRGGQSFFVCPRIEDIAEMRAFLAADVPEVKVAVAHGQMPATQLEDVMTAFYEGRHDVLLSTAIVESGLDIPTANTLVVHRADMFGLAQLYQLRGRVGRAKTRAYALFTLPANKKPTPTAEKRLKVLMTLDTLGAGFQLASHDLDIRGAGNLLGEEQSGHIKEVGYELYQQMLEEAVAQLKAGVDAPSDQWSPSIGLGAPVMIPETYVADLDLRMELYRRLATLETDEAIRAFAAELVDRFGPIPDVVEQLLEIVAIKALCRQANVEKIEAGPKGVVLAFRDNSFAEPEALVGYIGGKGTLAKVRPDMRVAFFGSYETVEARVKAATRVLKDLVGLTMRRKAA